MKLAIIGLLMLAAVAVEKTTARPASACGGNPADVVFVLDTSNSIWEPNFHRQLQFVRNVVSLFRLGKRHIRVGLVTFSDHPRLQFHLNRYRKKKNLKRAISRVRQEGGIYTYTGDAIRFVRENCFTEAAGARPDTTKVVIVLTDGLSYDPEVTTNEAAKARAAGLHMFAVGIGNQVDLNELNGIASHPPDYYRFMVQGFAGLKKIKSLLAIKTCSVTDPPPTTTTPAPSTTPSLRSTTPSLRSTTPSLRSTTPSLRSTSPTLRSTRPFLRSTSPTMRSTSPNLRSASHLLQSTTENPSPRPQVSFFKRMPVVLPRPNILPHMPGEKNYAGARWGTLESRGREVTSLDLSGKKRESYNGNNAEVRFDNSAVGGVVTHHRLGLDQQGCIAKDDLDLVFVVDPKTGGTAENRALWKFVRQIVAGLDLGKGNVRVRFVRDCLDVPEIALDRFLDKTQLLDELSQRRGETSPTPELLRRMTLKLKDVDGDKPANSVLKRRKVAVYLTDGASGDLETTLREVQAARFDNDVEVYGIGVGPGTNPTELRAIPSCPTKTHLHTVADHRYLYTIAHKLTQQLCYGSEHS